MHGPSLLSRLSISTRLALWYGLSLLILLTIFVAGLYTSVHVGLHRSFDQRLRTEAETIRQHLQAHAPEAHALTVSMDRTSGAAVRLLDADGGVVHASPSKRTASLAPPPPAERVATTRRHTWNGRPAQTRYLPLETAHAPARWLAVTRIESGLHRQLHRLRWWLVLGILLGAGGAVGIGYGLARRALRPVAALTEAANEMQDRPTGTLPTDFGVEDELSALADTFNDLFRRLREMVARERRFRADAAHEMFTPLTAIQNEIDVTLRGDRPASAYRDTLATVRAHTNELSAMLDRLMTLSRAEARERGPATEHVDVAQRVQERTDQIRPRAHEQQVALSVEGGPADAPIQPEHLDTIVDHLLDNALKYTPEGGRVQVTAEQEEGAVVLRVSDTGIGFEPDEAERLFDRFYRGTDADDQARGGGLGLSVVQALVRSYDGTVTARSDGPGTGSTFVVTLPAATD
jgi:signal transduction histidine kinase